MKFIDNINYYFFRFSFKINFHNGGGEQQKGSRVYHLGTECQVY